MGYLERKLVMMDQGFERFLLSLVLCWGRFGEGILEEDLSGQGRGGFRGLRVLIID